MTSTSVFSVQLHPSRKTTDYNHFIFAPNIFQYLKWVLFSWLSLNLLWYLVKKITSFCVAITTFDTTKIITCWNKELLWYVAHPEGGRSLSESAVLMSTWGGNKNMLINEWARRIYVQLWKSVLSYSYWEFI